MNIKTTITVVLLAIALGLYFLVSQRNPAPRQADDGGATAVGQLLFKPGELSVEKVNKLHIKTSDGEMTAEREGKRADDWSQVAPVRFPMQGWQVRDIVADASELRYTSTFKAGGTDQTLDKLGLQPPRAVVTFEGEGVKQTMTLGRTAGVGRAYVVLGEPTATSTVYVVSDRLHDTLLKKKVRDLRSTTLASIEPGNATRITLKHTDQNIELRKGDNGRWTLTQPVSGRADKEAAHDLVRAITTAMIDQFVQDNPSDLAIYGLAKPTHVLTVETAEATAAEPAGKDSADSAAKKDGVKSAPAKKGAPAPTVKTYTLKIGAPADLSREKYFAMWQDTPIVFQLRKADVEKLQKQPNDLRDPKLIPVARTDVREVTLDRGKAGKVHMIQGEGGWQFGEPKPVFTLDGGVMDELLTAIIDTKAVGYVPLKDARLTAPIAQIALGVLARPEPEELTLRDHETGRLLVVRGNEDTGYLVEREKLELALKSALAFRNRNVLDIQESALTSLHIVRSGAFPAEYTIHRAKPSTEGPPAPGQKDAKDAAKPGEWITRGLDAPAAKHLISLLAPLRATQWLAEPPVTTPEGVSIELTLADGSKRKVFIHPQSRTARVGGIDAAFTVDQALVDAAEAELRNRVVLVYDNDQIREVKIGDATVRKLAGKFTMTGGSGKLDITRAGAMFDTLAGLMIGHFVEPTRATGAPAATLAITTADNKTHTLKVWMPAEGDAVGQLGDKTFVFEREKAAKIVEAPAANGGAK